MAAALATVLLIAVAPPARASGEGCEAEWTLDAASYEECRSIAALNPGNDTRVNLLLLLLDRQASPPPAGAPVPEPVVEWREFAKRFAADNTIFAFSEGSLCRSNDAGAAAFADAVRAAGALTAAEREALLSARKDIAAVCSGHIGGPDEPGGSDKPIVELLAGMTTKPGKDFASYLRGTLAFYRERLNDAADEFALARHGADPWLADAASYMVARTDVNRVQVGAFDEYGTFRGSRAIDAAAAAAAQASLADYLREHPTGRYVRSARGLERRVAWLAGWTETLAGLYAGLIATPAPDRGIDEVGLVVEIDGKLLPDLKPAMTANPVLLAVLDLQAMRRPPGAKDEEWRKAAISQAALDAQRPAFAAAMPLYEFLQAARAFYVAGDAEAVVRALPDDTRRRDGDFVWFSRQMLRGQALEARGDRNARGFWKELYPGAARAVDASTVELALALHDDAHGHPDETFAPGSLVRNQAMRDLLLQHSAGPALLRRVADDAAATRREARLARSVLLEKDLTHAFYSDFLADLASAEAGDVSAGAGGDKDAEGEARPADVYASDAAGEIGCPALRVTAGHLAAGPDNPRDRLCLAEFERLHVLGSGKDTRAEAGSLGGGPPQFPGQALTRAAIYRAVIADRAAAAADRAYALYRAVRCYEPTGVNECGGADVPKATRKGWYNELRRSYPASRWAKELLYWW